MTKTFIIALLLTTIKSQSYSQTAEIEKFWVDFKNAVISRDSLKMTSMIDFSKSNGLIGKDTSEFYSNFNSIFDNKTVEIIVKTERLSKTENNEYLFVGSGAYKFFYFKKIDKKFKLYRASYYD